MPRKCPECLESGDRRHLPGCSYGPGEEERTAFIKEHAVEMVRKLEDKVRKQAKIITGLESKAKSNEKRAKRLRGLLLEAQEYVASSVTNEYFTGTDELLAKIDGILQGVSQRED